MKYYRLSGGKIQLAPACINNVFNPSEQTLLSFGYKPIEYKKLNIPVYKSINGNYQIAYNYSDNGENIVAEEILVKKAKPDYSSLVENMIAEKYSLKQEIAINRQRQSKTEEFSRYYDYCEQCKTRAKAIADDWESADQPFDDAPSSDEQAQ